VSDSSVIVVRRLAFWTTGQNRLGRRIEFRQQLEVDSLDWKTGYVVHLPNYESPAIVSEYRDAEEDLQ
jgi:hypothetical protein